MLCAPPRTATSRPLAAANRTAACTSDSSAHRATASGRRSTAAFQTRRLSSYVGSSAPMTSPRSRLRSSSIGALAVWVMACLPLVRGGRKNTSPVAAAGTGVNKPPLTGVPRTVRYFLAALVVAAPFSVEVASGAQAQDVTCQGKAATVVGPTEGSTPPAPRATTSSWRRSATRARSWVSGATTRSAWLMGHQLRHVIRS